MNIAERNPTTPDESPAGNALTWHGHIADDVANTYGPEPMATLTATADLLVLSGPRGTFRVPRSAITKLGRGTLYPWLFKAVRVHHTAGGLPKLLQFQPIRGKPREVLDQLRLLGYPVA